MKVEICSFSLRKIYPGRGKLYVRGDSKVCTTLSLSRNPRARSATTTPSPVEHKRATLYDARDAAAYRRLSMGGSGGTPYGTMPICGTMDAEGGPSVTQLELDEEAWTHSGIEQRSIRPGWCAGPQQCKDGNGLQVSRTFRFISSKNESLFLQRKNPRKIAWTVFYRRMHKKGITEEVAKKRSRRTVKHQRAVVGASMEQISARRNQKPEVRAAARTEAIAKSKSDKKSAAEKRKTEKSK
ncbi:unnamed protein product, partial [Tilletia controversa]